MKLEDISCVFALEQRPLQSSVHVQAQISSLEAVSCRCYRPIGFLLTELSSRA